MNSIILDEERVSIIRQLLETDSMEVLRKVKQLLNEYTSNNTRPTPPCQYTVEELKEILAQTEAEGNGITGKEFFNEMKQQYPFL